MSNSIKDLFSKSTQREYKELKSKLDKGEASKSEVFRFTDLKNKRRLALKGLGYGTLGVGLSAASTLPGLGVISGPSAALALGHSVNHLQNLNQYSPIEFDSTRKKLALMNYKSKK